MKEKILVVCKITYFVIPTSNENNLIYYLFIIWTLEGKIKIIYFLPTSNKNNLIYLFIFKREKGR